jgi:uncharacterized protein (DUF433 family)
MSRGQLETPPTPLSDPHYIVPLYHKAEAARIIRVPRGTLRGWAATYQARLREQEIRAVLARSPRSREATTIADMLGGRAKLKDSELRAILARMSPPVASMEGPPTPALITTADPPTPGGPTIPFVGLTEAYVLAAFRNAGVPMQRIRPAVRRLEEEMGLTQALASERLRTDGAEVLWDYGQETDDQAEKEAVGDLVVVRNGQLVFRSVVQDYLQRVTYRDGWARVINVGRGKIDVTVDPWINGGHPTLARRGIAVTDVLSRIRAGEPFTAVAADYGLRRAEITALLELAA